jgi:hypothetical protein
VVDLVLGPADLLLQLGLELLGPLVLGQEPPELPELFEPFGRSGGPPVFFLRLDILRGKVGRHGKMGSPTAKHRSQL